MEREGSKTEVEENLKPDWLIKVEENLKLKIENNLDSMETEKVRWKKQSIYKVPASIIDLNKKAYKPQTVSLGPYHHGEDHLKAMEEHKDRALLHFLKRSRKSIECYVDVLAEEVDDLKDAYDQLDSKQLENEGFLKLMVLDGCFILEILRTATQTLNDYAPNDPIFSTHGKRPYIVPHLRRDMLLLENQLPLLVLEKLVAVEIENSEKGEEIVNELIFKFFVQEPVRDVGKCLHILDVYRMSLLRDRREKMHYVRQGDYTMIFSAAKLKEAGIVFQKSETESLMDISFNALGIIVNALGSDEAAAHLFNSISKDVELDPESRFDEVMKNVNDYCKNSWNAWRADIMQNYFRNPWVTLSVIAAILLFALTIIQTVFSVLSYVNYKP